MLISIVWHDVWKSRNTPLNLFQIIFNDIYDGWGSMRMFAKSVLNYEISNDLKRRIKYNIRMHSGYQLEKRKTFVSKIIRDLDMLELWSAERFGDVESKFDMSKLITKGNVRLAQIYINQIVSRQIREKSYYFEWSKKEHNRRKKIFIDFLNGLIRKYNLDAQIHLK